MKSREIPVRLEWSYQSPVCMTAHALHMDGVLASVFVQRAMASGDAPEHQEGAQPGDDYQQFIQDLPLSRAQFADGAWVWKASIAVAHTPQKMHRQTMTGRGLFDDMSRADDLLLGGGPHFSPQRGILGRTSNTGEVIPDADRFKLDNGRGLYRPELFEVSLRWYEGGRAWCVVPEDQYEVFLDALRDITAIGKKSARGYGLLKDPGEAEAGNSTLLSGFIRVTEDPAAFDLWQMRNLPDMPAPEERAQCEKLMARDGLGMAPLWATQRIALRSPYWQPSVLGVQCQCLPVP